MRTGGEAFIVRDNSDYVINFTFDVEWAEETAKTARFALQRGGYMDVPFTGSSVAVPVISTGRRVDVGVFAGNLRTTTSATLPLVPSIRSKGGAPVPPEDAVYDKLIALINSMGEISDDDIKQAVEDYLSANPIAALLVTILRNAEYSTDQSDNITALATALNATPEPDAPDEPDEPVVVRYAITNNLTECVNSNAATSLTEGASYTATLTASDGFVLDAVTVMMGGVDVTTDVYADGVITIPSVTGDVVITASAVIKKTEELPFVSGQTYTVDDLEVVDGNGFNSSGIISENSGLSYAIFPCRGANRAMFNSNIYANYGVLMLDADKKYIRTVGTVQTSGLFAENGITFAEISRDAEYIMFQCRSGNMQNITLELYQDPEYNGVYELNTWYRIPWIVGFSINTTTGVISENADKMCSDYMSIYGATTIQISNGLRHFHVFYDADKNYLSTVTVQTNAPASYDIPDGATYLVIAPPGAAQHHNNSIRITK